MKNQRLPKCVSVTVASLLVVQILSHDSLAETVVGLGQQNRIVTFDSSNPAVLNSSMALSGLSMGDTLVGLDYRPATGQLMGLGRLNNLYVIDPSSGAATLVGAGGLTPGLSGDAFGFDFNPTVDRIRVVSDNGQNLRLNPITGVVAATDGVLAYAAGDPNAGQLPQAVAAAYTDNVAGATTTTLYVMDSVFDTLVRQSPPNAGTLNTVGSLGINITDMAGFDISGATGAAYSSLVKAGDSWSGFYSIDLTSGNASLIGKIGNNELLVDMTVVPEPGTLALGMMGVAGLILMRRRK